MRIGGIIFPTFVPYDKPALEIYISGCTRKCPGCHNSELANFDYGKEVSDEWIENYALTREAFFDILGVTGGDLLCQTQEEAEKFSRSLRKYFPNKSLWLFTGEDSLSNVPDWTKEVYDVIKFGSYKQELKINGFPASANQKVAYKGKDY